MLFSPYETPSEALKPHLWAAGGRAPTKSLQKARLRRPISIFAGTAKGEAQRLAILWLGERKRLGGELVVEGAGALQTLRRALGHVPATKGRGVHVGAVVVAATSGNKPVDVGEPEQACDGGVVILAVVAFQPLQTRHDERREDLRFKVRDVCGVRQHWDAANRLDEPHRILRRQLVARNIARSAWREPGIEGVAHIRGIPLLDQRPRNMWPANGASRDLADTFPGDVESLLAQPLHDTLATPHARLSQYGQRPLEVGRLIFDIVTEHVRLTPFMGQVGVDLNTWHDCDA